MIITSILNQLDYPGGNKPGDPSYDCWVVSAIQCRDTVAGPPLPTITTFRLHAGDPLDGVSDKGNLTELVRGIRGTWPEQRFTEYRAAPWATFAADVKAKPLPASISVSSALLPLRYGYSGLHQVTVFYQGGGWWVANPLAKQGSAPTVITEAAFRNALGGYSNVGVYGVLFHEVTPVLPFIDSRAREIDLRAGAVLIDEAGRAVKTLTAQATVVSPFICDVTYSAVFASVDGKGVLVRAKRADRVGDVRMTNEVEMLIATAKAEGFAAGKASVPPDTTPYSAADVKAAGDGMRERARAAAIKGVGDAIDGLAS